MEITRGTIDDLIEHLGLIRSAIPAKAPLTPERIRERLESRAYGVTLAKEGGRIEGIQVWHEDHGDLYLWLAAVRKTGHRTGALMLEHAEATTTYRRWRVKTSSSNAAALRLLGHYGFRAYGTAGDIVYLDRELKR